MGLPYTRDVDSRFSGDWSKWQPPVFPPMPALAAWAGPWKRDITNAPVDHERTEQLVDLGGTVTSPAAGTPPEPGPKGGASWGMPFTEVDVETRQWATVWDLSRPVDSVPGPGWLGWLFRTLIYPTVDIPLPKERLRREGDPVGAADLHAYLYDDRAMVLYELLKLDTNLGTWFNTHFGKAPATVGYSGSGPGIARYDLSRAYRFDPSKPKDSSNSPHGVVAAGTPQAPMMVRFDEIEAGRIDHAIFAGAANTARGHVGWARGGDGTSVHTPIYTGDILRLRPELVDEFDPTKPAGIVAAAMAAHGVFIGDKSTTSDPRGKGIGWTRTQDRRWWDLENDVDVVDLELAVTDFELIVPAP
jgi:hypothetical protein